MWIHFSLREEQYSTPTSCDHCYKSLLNNKSFFLQITYLSFIKLTNLSLINCTRVNKPGISLAILIKRQRTKPKLNKNTSQKTKVTSNTEQTENPGMYAPNIASRDILLSL